MGFFIHLNDHDSSLSAIKKLLTMVVARQAGYLAVVSGTPFLAAIFVALRLYARHKQGVPLGWGEWVQNQGGRQYLILDLGSWTDSEYYR